MLVVSLCHAVLYTFAKHVDSIIRHSGCFGQCLSFCHQALHALSYVACPYPYPSPSPCMIMQVVRYQHYRQCRRTKRGTSSSGPIQPSSSQSLTLSYQSTSNSVRSPEQAPLFRHVFAVGIGTLGYPGFNTLWLVEGNAETFCPHTGSLGILCLSCLLLP